MNDRNLRQALNRAMGATLQVILAEVVSVDMAKKTVDVKAEGLDTVWKRLPYRPLVRDDDEGVSFDPDVGAVVLVLVDRQGRKRALVPPESFAEMHIVSSTASVRIDLTEKKLEAQVLDGARALLNGDDVEAYSKGGASAVIRGKQVIVNGGNHPAARGDNLKTWLIAAVPAGPSGPLTPPYPDNINNPNVLID